MDELEFEIYLSDLIPEAQERLLAFMKVKSATELNWDNDTLPVASVPAPDESFDDEIFQDMYLDSKLDQHLNQ